MEIWKDIPDTGGRLQISSYGRVRSFLRHKTEGAILRTTEDKKGYMRLRVTIDREKRCYKVHRLVAEAFVQNPNEFPQVNHIDGNKKNNRTDNLEWTTNGENARHAISTGLWENVFRASRKENESRKTPVIATDSKTGIEIRFDSVSSAERYFDSRHISDVLNGKRARAAGHYFRREVV